MAARPQWYFCSIGSMNSVQPYCRLAIITMQMMPRTSWPHRVHAGATAGSLADAVVISTPDRGWRCQYNSSLCSESLASRLTGPAAAMMERATSCGGGRRLRLAVASLTVPRWAGHPWRGPHVGSRTRSVAAIDGFRQADRADCLHPLFRLVFHGNNGAHRCHHCAYPAPIRRWAAEHALPISDPHVLDGSFVYCNRNSPPQGRRWDRRVVLVVRLVARAQCQRRAGAEC